MPHPNSQLINARENAEWGTRSKARNGLAEFRDLGSGFRNTDPNYSRKRLGHESIYTYVYSRGAHVARGMSVERQHSSACILYYDAWRGWWWAGHN